MPGKLCWPLILKPTDSFSSIDTSPDGSWRSPRSRNYGGCPACSAGVLLVPGTEVTPQRASHASSGCVHVEGSDVAETVSRMQAVLDHFRMEVLDQAA
ncbi:hypothetical protein ACWFQ8_07955 [Streptomyces sp. NPDC055254]